MTTWQVEFRGIDLYVEGEYIPEELEILYDHDMAGHPGSPEGFEINRIFIENTEVSCMLEEHMEEIEKLVLEAINSL